MPQKPATILLQGGLDLVTAQIAMPNGRVIGACNYEPDVSGYTSLGGFERYDGEAAPSDTTNPVEAELRRADIDVVPGTGSVLGVAVFNEAVIAWRDKLTGEAGMYQSTTFGWSEIVPGYILWYDTGTVEPVEGDVVLGGTSAAQATIARVVLQSGTFAGGTAAGYLVITDIVGTFTPPEALTTTSGGAMAATTLDRVVLGAGGKYDWLVHNFYGAAKRPRLYFANGESTAFEYDGEGWLAPIRTGTDVGALEDVSFVLEDDGDFVVTDSGDFVILDVQFDKPSYIAEYKNQLFLAYRSGAVINSGVGEPLDYRTATGAGEIDFGSVPTALLNASTALIIGAKSRIDYLTGNDISDFVLSNISKQAGGFAWSFQNMKGPTYVDDGGIRDLTTTADFGDWKAGTLSRLIEPLMKAKRAAGVQIIGNLKIKDRDQYRLFWDDGTGVCVYMGRKDPEILPFNLIYTTPFCVGSGELIEGQGERYFMGAEDGYVYEFNKGTSFDGEQILCYIRLAFNQIGSPRYNKRFHDFVMGVLTQGLDDVIDVAVRFFIDYGSGEGGTSSPLTSDVETGYPIVTTDYFNLIDFTQVVQGRVGKPIDGIGPNLSILLSTFSETAEPHTFTDCTINWSLRGLIRGGR